METKHTSKLIFPKQLLLLGIAIIGFFLFRYADLIFSYQLLGNSKDNIYFLGPLFKEINRQILQNDPAIYIDNLLGGIPFYNSAIFSINYPFYFFGMIDYGEGQHIIRTLTLLSVFHLAILYINVIVLCKALNLENVISVLSASFIIISSNTAFNTSWIIAIAGYAWVPLFFAGIFFILDSKDKQGIISLAIASLGFLAKPAQTSILAICFGAIIFLVGIFCMDPQKKKKALLSFIIAGAFIVGINLVGLLIVFQEFGEMVRFTPNGPITGHEAIPLTSYHRNLSFENIKHFFVYKNIFGPGHPYISFSATFLALLSFAVIFRDKITKTKWPIILLQVLLVFTFLLSLGRDTIFFNFQYAIPLINKIREPIRFLMVNHLVLLVLSGYTMQYFYKQFENGKNKNWTILIAVLLSVGLFLEIFFGKYSEPKTLLYIPVLLNLICIYFKPRLAILSSVVCSLFITSIIAPIGRLSPESKLEKETIYNPENDILEHITQVDGFKNYRLVFEDQHTSKGEWAQMALRYDLKSLSTCITPFPENQFLDIYRQNSKYNYMERWGAKYLISDKKRESTNKSKEIYSNEKYHLYELKQAFPYFYFANRLVEKDLETKNFINKIEREDINKNVTTINVGDLSKISHERKGAAEIIKMDITQDHRKKVTVRSDVPKLLIFNEYFNNKWKATLNGNSIPILRVNANQMGVAIPKGQHELEFEFQTKKYDIFKWIHLLSLLLLIVFIIQTLYSYYNRVTTLS